MTPASNFQHALSYGKQLGHQACTMHTRHQDTNKKKETGPAWLLSSPTGPRLTLRSTLEPLPYVISPNLLHRQISGWTVTFAAVLKHQRLRSDLPATGNLFV